MHGNLAKIPMQRITIRKIHRWLALALAIQVILWGISGAYMVWMKLSFIHGNHLADHAELTLTDFRPESLALVQARHPTATAIKWVNRGLPSAPAGTIEVRANTDRFLYSSETLELVRPTESDIISIANRVYRTTREANIQSAELLVEDAPRELFAGHLPVWKVTFDDWVNTTLYFKAETGELVTRRFSFWRGFDFFWMLHIMDYKDRENVQTPWLIALTTLSIAFVLTGGVLTTRRLRKRRKRAMVR